MAMAVAISTMLSTFNSSDLSDGKGRRKGIMEREKNERVLSRTGFEPNIGRQA